MYVCFSRVYDALKKIHLSKVTFELKLQLCSAQGTRSNVSIQQWRSPRQIRKLCYLTSHPFCMSFKMSYVREKNPQTFLIMPSRRRWLCVLPRPRRLAWREPDTPEWRTSARGPDRLQWQVDTALFSSHGFKVPWASTLFFLVTGSKMSMITSAQSWSLARSRAECWSWQRRRSRWTPQTTQSGITGGQVAFSSCHEEMWP